MEEKVGFEPTEHSHVRRFSRPLQSTALALLQGVPLDCFSILHKTFSVVKPFFSLYNFFGVRKNMFDYVKGLLTDKRKTSKGAFITIEAVGVGYLLEVTEQDFVSYNPSEETTQKFYTSLLHREDAMNLYGFSNKETRDIFQILLSVSGVGAKMAIALLNEFDACDLISFVIDGNFKELTRAKGVGPKLAQKIILELKDKLMKTELPKSSGTLPQNQAIADAQSIMLSLGYDNKEIEEALAKVISTVEDTSNPEEILRKALTCLSM